MARSPKTSQVISNIEIEDKILELYAAPASYGRDEALVILAMMIEIPQNEWPDEFLDTWFAVQEGAKN